MTRKKRKIKSTNKKNKRKKEKTEKQVRFPKISEAYNLHTAPKAN